MVTKYFITGNVIEVYTYENYIAGSGGKRERKEIEKEINEACERNYKNHCQTRLNNIRRLACSNFSKDSTFVTLTFDDKKVDFNIRNVQECRIQFKNFIKRLKYELKNQDLKYLAVIEFQDANDRGAIHYHVLFNVPYIDFYILSNIWGLGYVFINKINHVDNVGAYLVKYICKDGGDKRLMGQQAYLHSRNLILPKTTILLDEDVASKEYFEFDTLISKLETCYETSYNTELMGKCTYRQYNLERGFVNEH